MKRHTIYNEEHFERHRQDVIGYGESSFERGEDEIKDCPFISQEYVDLWQQGFAKGRLKKAEPFSPF